MADPEDEDEDFMLVGILAKGIPVMFLVLIVGLGSGYIPSPLHAQVETWSQLYQESPIDPSCGDNSPNPFCGDNY